MFSVLEEGVFVVVVIVELVYFVVFVVSAY